MNSLTRKDSSLINNKLAFTSVVTPDFLRGGNKIISCSGTVKLSSTRRRLEGSGVSRRLQQDSTSESSYAISVPIVNADEFLSAAASPESIFRNIAVAVALFAALLF